MSDLSDGRRGPWVDRAVLLAAALSLGAGSSAITANTIETNASRQLQSAVEQIVQVRESIASIRSDISGFKNLSEFHFLTIEERLRAVELELDERDDEESPWLKRPLFQLPDNGSLDVDPTGNDNP